MTVATLRDVAIMAGVHPSTASRVLSGDTSRSVKAETRQRIEAAAASLAYAPNTLARGLRTRRTNAVTLLAPDLENLGFAPIIRGAQDVAQEAGCLLLVVQSLETVAAVWESVSIEGLSDGLLVASATLDHPLPDQVMRADIPRISVNRRTKDIRGWVIADDERGARLAVDHLVESGHRDIAYVGGPRTTDTGRRRRKGFDAAVGAHGLVLRPDWLRDGRYTEAGGYEAARHILTRPGERPTAIFAANFMSALGVLRATSELGTVVPDELSVLGFDGPPLSAHTSPPLTMVEMPLDEVGAEGMRMLLDVIAGGNPRRLKVASTPTIRIRGSVARPRA